MIFTKNAFILAKSESFWLCEGGGSPPKADPPPGENAVETCAVPLGGGCICASGGRGKIPATRSGTSRRSRSVQSENTKLKFRAVTRAWAEKKMLRSTRFTLPSQLKSDRRTQFPSSGGSPGMRGGKRGGKSGEGGRMVVIEPLPVPCGVGDGVGEGGVGLGVGVVK